MYDYVQCCLADNVLPSLALGQSLIVTTITGARLGGHRVVARLMF
jgi:hypothetical protein